MISSPRLLAAAIDRARAGRSVVLLGAALVVIWLRLINLGQPNADLTDTSYDEGIRLAQLALMDAGFRPFRDIYASQGPLLLDYFHAFYATFGHGVQAARLGGVVGSLAALVAVALAARQLFGPAAGGLALLLLGLSPLFLAVSRLALAEAPSVGFAALAFWGALIYRQRGGRRALAATLGAVILAVLLKPMAGVVAVPIAVAVAPRVRALGRTAWLLGGGVVLLGGLAVVWHVGPSELLDQFVRYRLGALGIGAFRGESWSPGSNLLHIVRQLGPELPWLAFALASWPLVARRDRPAAHLAGCWLAATLALLLVYSPLSWKHPAYLIPPLALLGAGGLVALARTLAELLGRRIPWRALPAGVGLAWAVASAPASAAAVGDLLAPVAVTKPGGNLADALGLLARHTSIDDYVITDHPYLAYVADRHVPPRLADPSRTRILAGSLRFDELVEATEQYNPAAVVLWAGRFEMLPDYVNWLSYQYRLVRVYDRNQAFYLRPDLAAMLEPGAMPSSLARPAEFAAPIALVGAAVEPGPNPRSPRLSTAWRALDTPDGLYTQAIELRVGGRTVQRRESRLLPPWHIAAWPTGAIISHRHAVSFLDLVPGEYEVVLLLRRAGTSENLPLRSGQDAAHAAGDAGVQLGRLSIE